MRNYPRVSISIDPLENMTKQSFKKECDINEIMKKFQTTGVIDHYAKRAPEFIDVPTIEYQDALQIVIDAEDNFAALPSSIRAKFHNDPAEYLQYVENPENLDEMRTLGLANPLPVQPKDPAPTPRDHAPASNKAPDKKE